EHLTQARASVKPDSIATIIYTSGTTGTPKGVMLTHANLVFDLLAAVAALPVIDPNDVILSYLPLCHSFERIANYFMFACGAQIVLAESIETLAENMRDARPTIVTSVPRMFERMHKRILESIQTQPEKKQKIFHWAVRTGKQYKAKFRTRIISPLFHIKYALAEKLVFVKLRSRVGGRMRFFVSGGAALSKDLGEFFDAAGITIIEGYGMTEASPVISVNPTHGYKFGTVGKPLPGVEVKIASDGEILTHGGHVMLGYWQNETATQEAIDADGWLHTGDIGTIDGEGYIAITDRKKDLFVSSGGKNIAPQHIENLLLESPYIDQIVLVGDHKPFIAALIVPEFTMLREAAEKKGIPSLPNEEFIKHSEIITMIEKDINTLQSALANFERVRRFTLLAEPFTVESGDLTPTLKVKRSIVTKKFSAQIQRMYAEVLN
ncbi:MAG TPA: long-chain fatty acid--CoA ligase, partial [Candidatus Kapabacteria bacterium]|nr:long-chain fatty acid--CoA ligase [Candidatus Kapabacteria bacterium]